jgi:hypothetical protein
MGVGVGDAAGIVGRGVFVSTGGACVTTGDSVATSEPGRLQAVTTNRVDKLKTRKNLKYPFIRSSFRK